MSLKFAWMKLDDLLMHGVEDLLMGHWEEVAVDKQTIPYAPDWDRYRTLEASGSFKALSAWKQGRLVGYNAFFVMPHIHYRHSTFAINDVLYVDPWERGEAGVRLLLTAERDLFKGKTVKICYHAKPNLRLGLIEDKRDSLDMIEAATCIEDEFGVTLPDDILADHTLGGLLKALGYNHFEEVWAKTRTT